MNCLKIRGGGQTVEETIVNETVVDETVADQNTTVELESETEFAKDSQEETQTENSTNC